MSIFRRKTYYFVRYRYENGYGDFMMWSRLDPLEAHEFASNSIRKNYENFSIVTFQALK